jgi:small subunit ribosomal protein S1
VHISELAERHVEIPEQIVQVNDDVMVKIIDIDLERRRISLSLKQANESAATVAEDTFDPTLYGMTASYDDQGNYIYPEGFDPETGEWLSGFDEARAAWEQQYAEAHTRWEAHKKQIEEAQQAELDAGEESNYSSDSDSDSGSDSGAESAASEPAPAPTPEPPGDGALASDEALQALREKLTGQG